MDYNYKGFTLIIQKDTTSTQTRFSGKCEELQFSAGSYKDQSTLIDRFKEVVDNFLGNAILKIKDIEYKGFTLRQNMSGGICKELNWSVKDDDNYDLVILKFRDYVDKALDIYELVKKHKELEEKSKKIEVLPHKFPKIIATVYWWTKAPGDEYVNEENIVENLDEELLVSLGLRYGSSPLTNINQIDYISEFMDSDIDTEEYDYFFEYYGEVEKQ